MQASGKKLGLKAQTEDVPLQSTPDSPNNQSQSDYGDFPSFVYTEDIPEDLNNGDSMKELHTEGPNDRSSATVNDDDEDTPESHGMLPPPKPSISPNLQMTSEEYNAQLLSDPRMRQSSVVNPEFLQQYYRESRLHHLSTWKAELKAQLQAAAKEKSQSQMGKKKPVPGARRYILHVDFDSFFAAVSLLKRPDLRDKPVAIAHGAGSGSEIASCNYAARARGVKNGMWMKGAQEACPELQVLPYDFAAYEDASKKFYSCVLSIDGVVQSVSIDEALVDVTTQCNEAGGSDGRGVSEGSIYREQARANEIAQSLRDSIKEQTLCAVSVGIGGNILQAKVALRKAKPAGQFQLKPEDVLAFIGDLAVRDLPGVGYSMTAKLEEIGVKLVKDIRDLSRERLSSALGPKTGTRLWEYSRGMDKTEVGNEVVRKSISAEVNWGIRFTNQEQAEGFMKSLCEELNRRLVDNLVKGKHLTLKVMRRSMDAPLEAVKHLGHGKCDTFNKSAVMGVATNAPGVLAKEAISMLRSYNFSPGDLRGLGVQMTKLEPLKPGASASLDSSQRLLSFSKSPAQQNIVKTDTPSRHKVELPVTPAHAIDSRSIDTGGSQFIMPTQADPAILSELPGDIRSRLVAQVKHPQDPGSGSSSPCPPLTRNQPSTRVILPPQSQLDPEILAALPDDVRNEILGYYDPDPSPVQEPRLPVPSTSPPPTAPISRPVSAGTGTLKRPYSPPKKRRGRPPKIAKVDNSHKQTLADFVSRPANAQPLATPTAEEAANHQGSPAIEEQSGVSAEFLAALPEDIRQEILEEQRRSHALQESASGPAPVPVISRETPPPGEQDDDTSGDQVERHLPLPPLPARPVFTSLRIWELPDLRDAVEEWHSTFAAEGPYTEDVEVLCTYLGRVVVDEKDIDKAVSLVRWVTRLVDEHTSEDTQNSQQPPHSEQGIVTWVEAIATLYGCVQTALEARGLPPVDFD